MKHPHLFGDSTGLTEQHFGTLPHLKLICLKIRKIYSLLKRQAFNNLLALTNARYDAGMPSRAATFDKASLPGTAIYSAYGDAYQCATLNGY